jgi:putative hydrolase of the HAD superfamily
VALRPSAVLLDLYGTLVPGGTTADRDAVTEEVGRALGVDPQAMAAAMRASYDDRARGRLGDLPATLRALAARLGGAPDEPALARACELRLSLWREVLAAPPPATLEALDRLRAERLPLALVSDCSIETPMLWAGSPLARRFEVAAFSAVVGVRKPHPDIYRAAYEPLGVEPEACLFVGDGGSRELTGAAALGMRAVRLETDGNGRVDPDLEWSGPSIASLAELRV